jgi:hypothetical protein
MVSIVDHEEMREVFAEGENGCIHDDLVTNMPSATMAAGGMVSGS